MGSQDVKRCLPFYFGSRICILMNKGAEKRHLEKITIRQHRHEGTVSLCRADGLGLCCIVGKWHSLWPQQDAGGSGQSSGAVSCPSTILIMG